ncbi:hypothetical protein ACHWQZ_G006383 [Mnemiopsis leidyi]
MWRWLAVRRRFIAYFCLICNAYTELSSRFGVSISMIGGMVKKDCDDPGDIGQFCWSDSTQALVLGAYFYGYTAQCLTTFVAKEFIGFTTTYRLWLISAAALQLCYSSFASLSSSVVIASQVVRGLLGGIMMSYSFDFVSKYSVGNESQVVIALIGATNYVGGGTGSVLAGFITSILGWQYYFYYSGICYFLGFILAVVFLQESPQKCWYMTCEEKDEILKRNGTKNNPRNHPEDDGPSGARRTMSLCQLYLVAFSIYLFSYNLVVYDILSTIPFYLNEVTGADPIIISYLNISLTLLIAFCTLTMTYVVRRVDKFLTWLQCRMLFTLVPMFSYIVLFITLSFHINFVGVTVALAVTAIMASTLFSGSIFMVNFEIDPENAALRTSIFNSFGQASGFVGPLLMAAITTTNPDNPDYITLYRQRWSYFFYAVAGFAALGCFSIVLAYIIKPDEWVNRNKNVYND